MSASPPGECLPVSFCFLSPPASPCLAQFKSFSHLRPHFLFPLDITAQALSHQTSPHSRNTPRPSTAFSLCTGGALFLEYPSLPSSWARAEGMGRRSGHLAQAFRPDPVGWCSQTHWCGKFPGRHSLFAGHRRLWV